MQVYVTKTFTWEEPNHSNVRKRIQKWLNEQASKGYHLLFQTQSSDPVVSCVIYITYTLSHEDS